MSYTGTVKNGVIVLDPTVKLPEGMVVQVETETWDSVFPKAQTDNPEDDPALKMLEHAGPTGIPDLSVNLDHYLYGHPKVSDGR
jgi:hypothetical protein